MAAAITTILALNKTKETNDKIEDGDGKNPSIPGLLPSSTTAVKPNDPLARHVVHVQRLVRGHLTRKQHRRMMERALIVSRDGVVVVVTTAKHWHAGWWKFCTMLTYLTLFVVMISVQLIIYDFPSAYDTNRSVEDFLANAVDPLREATTQSQDIYDYVETLLESLYATDFYYRPVTESPECEEAFSQYCVQSSAFDLNRTAFANCLRPRDNGTYIDNQNRVLVAVFVIQTRRLNVTCESLAKNPFPVSDHECLSETGLDTTYTSNYCDANPTECASQTGGFFYNPYVEGFMEMFDAAYLGIPLEVSKCHLDTLRAKQWLDYKTNSACVSLFFFNANARGRVTLVTDCFQFDISGHADFSRELASSALITVSSQAGAIVITSLVMVFTVLLFAFDMRQCRRKSRRGLGAWAGPTVASKFSHGCELVCSLLFLLFVTTSVAVYATWVDMAASYTPHTVTPELILDPVPFWKDILAARDVVAELAQYQIVLVFTLCVILYRLVLTMDFHPALAIVTRTIAKAASNLLSFIIVFGIVMICYAVAGVVLLGATSEEFSTFGSAFNQLLLTMLLDSDVSSVIFDSSVSSSRNKAAVQALYYWTFIALTTILLLNVLLSIIVDAFVQLSTARKEGGGVFWDLHESFLMFCYVLAGAREGRGAKLWALARRYDEEERGRYLRTCEVRRDLETILAGEYVEKMIRQMRELTARDSETEAGRGRNEQLLMKLARRVEEVSEDVRATKKRVMTVSSTGNNNNNNNNNEQNV